MNEELIAPCGMNCAICSSYLAMKNNLKVKGIHKSYCIGCRPKDKKCAFIKKRCQLLMNDKVKYCYECKNFPCHSLQTIDARYRKNYNMSMIENLKFIKETGITKFLMKEAKKWECPKCKEIICCHNGLCFNCEFDKLKNKKKQYRWSDE